MMTSAVDTSIQLTSPLLATGADDAAAGADAAAATTFAPDAAGAAAVAAAGAGVVAEAAVAGASAAAETPTKPRAARPRAMEAMNFFMGCLSGLRTSERVLAGFARADADDLFQRRNEDLP